jgi:sec-independent protein translocase protein TatA
MLVNLKQEVIGFLFLKNIFMGPIGFNEILIILVIILLLFGAKKIPDLMRGVGKGIREFSDAKKGEQKD